MPIPALVEHVTFEDGDLVWGAYAKTRFVECTFEGVAKFCDFGNADFVDCTFGPSFQLATCNIGGAEGLPERFHAPPRRLASTDFPLGRHLPPRFHPGR